MNSSICQSCGLTFGMVQDYGTNQDGSYNEEYCIYCYQEGKFTSELTLEEMITLCIPIVKLGDPEIEDDQARELLADLLPGLKRWKKD